MDSPRHTCLKLEVRTGGETERVFVKGTWYPTRFDISVTDGFNAWICLATEEEVEDRAVQWDLPVAEYIDLAEKYLGFQKPGSIYGFSDAGNGHRRLSWTFEKEGTKLEWRWKCQPSPNTKKTIADILDFLMDANIKLSEEVVWKTKSFDRLKVEAEKCLAQSEKLSTEKAEFESEIYKKFVQVLNSKKAKLRELRDQRSKQVTTVPSPDDDEGESTDRTQSFDEESDEEENNNKEAGGSTSTSKNPPATKPRSRKRK